jgi:hypothetical protein
MKKGSYRGGRAFTSPSNMKGIRHHFSAFSSRHDTWKALWLTGESPTARRAWPSEPHVRPVRGAPPGALHRLESSRLTNAVGFRTNPGTRR